MYFVWRVIFRTREGQGRAISEDLCGLYALGMEAFLALLTSNVLSLPTDPNWKKPVPLQYCASILYDRPVLRPDVSDGFYRSNPSSGWMPTWAKEVPLRRPCGSGSDAGVRCAVHRLTQYLVQEVRIVIDDSCSKMMLHGVAYVQQQPEVVLGFPCSYDLNRPKNLGCNQINMRRNAL